MDSVLPEWYGHDEQTIERIVVEGTIALDANAMLDLYRVGADQRETVLSVLGGVKDRLYVPYQAAYEFQKNRLTVARETERVFESLTSQFTVSEATLSKIRDDALRAEVKRISDDAQKKVTKKIAKLRRGNVVNFSDVRGADPIRAALDEIIGGSVGQRPSADVLSDRRKEAQRRLDERIPPGYMDAKAKPDADGDYLIWAELLEYVAESDRPLLFVTNDEKEDWRQIHSGHTLGPRVELLAEMHEASAKNGYHQVSLSTLLHLAKQHLNAEVDDATIEAVERVARHATWERDASTRSQAESYLANVGAEALDSGQSHAAAMWPGAPGYSGVNAAREAMESTSLTEPAFRALSAGFKPVTGSVFDSINTAAFKPASGSALDAIMRGARLNVGSKILGDIASENAVGLKGAFDRIAQGNSELPQYGSFHDSQARDRLNRSAQVIADIAKSAQNPALEAKIAAQNPPAKKAARKKTQPKKKDAD